MYVNPVYVTAAVVAVLGIGLTTRCTQIDSSELGVKRVWGVVQEKPAKPGLHVTWIGTKIEKVSMAHSDTAFVDEEGDTSKIWVTTKDGLQLAIPMSVGWAINPKYLTTVKAQEPGYYTDRQYTIIRAAVRDAASQFTYQEIFADRERLRATIEAFIRRRTREYYAGMGFPNLDVVTYSQVSLRQIAPTDALVAAREDLLVAPLEAEARAARTKVPVGRSTSDYTKVMQAQAMAKAVESGQASITVVQSDNPNVLVMPKAK